MNTEDVKALKCKQNEKFFLEKMVLKWEGEGKTKEVKDAKKRLKTLNQETLAHDVYTKARVMADEIALIESIERYIENQEYLKIAWQFTHQPYPELGKIIDLAFENTKPQLSERLGVLRDELSRINKP